MKNAIIAALLICGVSSAHAQTLNTSTGNASVALPNTNTVSYLFPPAAFPRIYWRVCNVNAASGATAWLSRFSATPAPNAPGSYPLPPNKCEEYYTAGGGAPNSYVPQQGLWAVSDTTGTVALTVEAH